MLLDIPSGVVTSGAEEKKRQVIKYYNSAHKIRTRKNKARYIFRGSYLISEARD